LDIIWITYSSGPLNWISTHSPPPFSIGKKAHRPRLAVVTLVYTKPYLYHLYINASEEFDKKDPDNKYAPTVKGKVEEILRLIHDLTSVATAHGFFLRHWIHVINVMVYKKTGCMELDCLWVIHLLEADFNMFIGVLFGRRAMHHSVSHNLLHSGQYEKPGGECQDAALSKVLHNLLAFFTKMTLGQIESDATGA
jgi:hypothetical protein